MAGRWFAKRFPRRLPASAADLARMAWNPSYRTPHPSELLHPDPFVPPGPPPMSAAERGLLDAVLADPDADEPRLRYADWCDRQGDERGEFIRLQIERSRRAGGVSPLSLQIERSRRAVSPLSLFPSGGLRPPLGGLADRERELLAAHGSRWCAPFAPWSARDIEFRRGFAEAMSLTGRAFVSLGDGLFRTTPLRDVRLVAVAPFLDELARTANLAKLDRLDLSGNRVGPAGVRELAGSPHLARLRELDLTANDLDAAAAAALAGSPHLAGLRVLRVANNPGLPAEAIEALRKRFGEGVLLR
jgi:uncharacterized protein (TIGR02996 family)